MSRTRIWVRIGLLAVFVPHGAVFGRGLFVDAEDRQKLEASIQRATKGYDRVVPGMNERQVNDLLGSEWEWHDGHDLPRTIGQMPECATGCRIRRQNYGSPTMDLPRMIDIPPDRPVRWKVWSVPGELRWIAVAFVIDQGLWEPSVIAKRCGRQS